MKLPSRQKLTQWLFVAAALFFFVSTIGKQQFPSCFEIVWIQWAYRICWGANTIIVPLGIVLALTSLVSSEVGSKERKDAGGKAWFFLVTFCSTLLMQVFIGFAIYGMKLNNPSDELVPVLISKIGTEESSKIREGWASALYRQTGIVVPYQLDDGSYISYKPSLKDKRVWTETKMITRSMKESLSKIHFYVHEALGAVIVELVAFFVIVSGGLLIASYRGRGISVECRYTSDT